MKVQDRAYIVWNVESGLMACQHCGNVYSPHIPCLLDMMIAMLRVWSKAHRHCAPRADSTCPCHPRAEVP